MADKTKNSGTGGTKRAPRPNNPRNRHNSSGETKMVVYNPVRETIARETKKEVHKEIKKEEKKLVAKHDSDPGRIVHHVKECTAHYASARLWPFGTITGACLPQPDFTFPSQKLKVMCSGSMALGTTGVGYILFRPSWGNNSGPIVVTGATSVGTLATGFNSFTNLTTFNFPELPYNAAAFGADLQGRYLAGGIRVSYVGKMMDQNGIIYCHTDPEHSALGTQTVNSISNLQHTRRIPVTGNVKMGNGSADSQWLGTTIDNGPAVIDEVQFKASDKVMVDPYMLIAIVGLPGDLWQFEVVEHVELMGRLVPSETESHSDSVDYPVVDKVIKQSFENGPPQPKENVNILGKIRDGIMEGLPMIQKAMGFAKGLSPIVTGLMNLVPLTGGLGSSVPQGWSGGPSGGLLSHDVVKYRQVRIDTGLGRGSNVQKSPSQIFYEALEAACTERNITPQHLLSAIMSFVISDNRREAQVEDRDPKRRKTSSLDHFINAKLPPSESPPGTRERRTTQGVGSSVPTFQRGNAPEDQFSD